MADATVSAILVAADVDLRAFNERALPWCPLETVIVSWSHLASQTHRLACPLHLKKLNSVSDRFEVLKRTSDSARRSLLEAVLLVKLTVFAELSLSPRIFI